MKSKLGVLQSIPLFRNLTEDELQYVWNITIQRSYRKKEIIFREASDKEAVYFIQRGLVKAWKTDENGNEHIICFLKPGDMFPHTGFFNQAPYPATTEAIVDTQLYAIPIQAFETLMMNIPEIAIKVMRGMGEKIAELQKKLQEMTGHDVNERAMLFLLQLAENNGTDKDGVIHIPLPLTHQDFASAIGTTRETANRFINQLRKKKVLQMDRRGLMILDLNTLKEQAAFST
ncbi:Crp/Fnr family transcriptional regulator [Bacillus horti]|uniref:CRP/FNR family transcriptional regulator n=1 Tax=Caldalkalibacillus horti TaxID=77523 RepID=A0ABT9VY21_9BACI|nr:Crp/Fnr family transcriptional regulator [Bacillus horti]MDQ0165892.1 CRP/FNR family transcriptional regulator [Bacillus horti]